MEEHPCHPKSCKYRKSAKSRNRKNCTVPARTFLPTVDIFETEPALTLVLEMPGVDKSHVDVSIENGVLTVQGRLDFSKYEGLQPVYTEYNVGDYRRSSRSQARSIKTRSAPR